MALDCQPRAVEPQSRQRRSGRLLLAVVLLYGLKVTSAGADALPDYRPRGQAVQHLALIDACVANDLDAVRRALKRGADPAWVVPDRYAYVRGSGPAVLMAAAGGQPDIMQLLLEQRPELAKTYGRTLLDKTIAGLADKSDRNERTRYERIIKLLLDRKVDVTRPDLGGYTPLMVAARFGQSEVVRLLLGAGANVSAKNNKGETALTLSKTVAQRRPEHEVIAKLLAPGP